MRLKLVPEITKFDFFGRDYLSLGLSVTAMLASIILFMVNGLNYGIDFRGGTMIMADTPQAVAVSQYRAVLGGLAIGDSSVTEISDPAGTARHAVVIRIEQEAGDPAIQAEIIVTVKAALSGAFEGIDYLQTESVGGVVSGELIRASVLAVLAAVTAILFYIWLRYEWQFSVGAVAALVHDVVLTIGIFSLTQMEFNLEIIAALLTIVGYSLNDTVVVFDRARENLRKMKTVPLVEVLNLSINDTLSRTVMTSGTTLLALVALYVLGGEVIRGFTFAMIWGIVVGTYSSVFVASAILLRLGVKRDWSKQDPSAGTKFADIDA